MTPLQILRESLELGAVVIMRYDKGGYQIDAQALTDDGLIRSAKVADDEFKEAIRQLGEDMGLGAGAS